MGGLRERDETRTMTLPHNEIRNQRRRVNRLRDKAFPHATCGASRHLHMVADMMSNPRCPTGYLSTPEDREHIAGSLYAVVEALWRARLELMALRAAAPGTKGSD